MPSFNPMNSKISVAGIIFNKAKDNVLLIKRRDIPVWVLPGGGLEKDESFERGAQRETEEETGLKVTLVRPVGIFYPRNKLTKLTYLFEFDIIGGSFQKGPETLDIQFFSIKNLPTLMPPPYEEWIKEASLFLGSPLEKITESVTYLTLLKKLIRHPCLVSKYFLKKIPLLYNKNYFN